MAIPGPRIGFLSSSIARAVIETVAAICTFALGRGVALPPTVIPTKQENVPELHARRADQTILTLAREHISLDIFSAITLPGGREFFERLRAAFLTFDAAFQQRHKFVASILYVICAEALTTPNAHWRDTKPTKRFIEFFDELIPLELDTIVNHDNFEEAFRTRRRSRTPRKLRRELLDKIYELRSGLVHSGLQPSYTGLEIDTSDDIRCNLMADFAEGAILGYLASPRSSLIGHPEITKA